LHDEVAEWIKLKEVREVLALGRKYGFAVSEVMDDVQISEDEWRRERGSVVSFEDEMYKKLVMEGPIAMLSKTPGRIKWLTRPLGYHNRYALKKLLALSEAEIKELEKERVVGYWDYRVGQRPPVYYDIRKDPVFNYEGGDNH
jgi:crotonobetainyl-CoA:carnitine CoA-transferase CaiB-like acyl-CoA transferase